MFEQILQLVKEHLDNNPQLTQNIPNEQADAIHREIATHINNGLQNQQTTPASAGGLLSQLESSLSSGNLLTSSISGGLIGSLGSKFGLSPAITGAIAASLPALLQKYIHRNDPAGSGVTAVTS
ncbi:MAG TPA: hypothetical protein VGZ90_00795 [Puia sp.]|jgi:hypothetical protein|nr:hypothetical protein [Puia sp.]